MIQLNSRVIRHGRALVVVTHISIFALSYALAIALRFDFAAPAREVDRFLLTLPWLLVVRIAAFWLLHLFEGVWRYVSTKDVIDLVKGVTASSACFVLGVFLVGGHSVPRSVLALDWFLCLGLTGGLRLAARLAQERRPQSVARPAGAKAWRRSIVVGAGDVAEALLREIRRRALPYEVVGLIDDHPKMRGRRIHGVPVLGTIDELAVLSARLGATTVLLASPDLSAADARRIGETCREAGIRLRRVPSVSQLLKGASVDELQAVSFEELLGRSVVGTEFAALRERLQGRRVLVTGGAGSIGSELSRQIAGLEPESLVLLDRAESDLYFALLELREKFPDAKIEAVIGDILDGQRMDQVMQMYAPDVVYHAAAYKHVPLMEIHPLEAIKNNVLGTEVTARAAIRSGVQEFVLISTDKAVRPVGVMGMTKRAAELLLRSLSGQGTTFVAVRFGNVLGSNGSVLPLFQKQIAARAPITITDPDASRYFMLTSEAVELVLQAGSLGRDGEVYVLNMGEPIRIGELAENLIRLSGLEPGVDIPIRVTGLRPGERLREELLVEEHVVKPGPHEKIFVVSENGFDEGKFKKSLSALRSAVELGDEESAQEILGLLVAPYATKSVKSVLAG